MNFTNRPTTSISKIGELTIGTDLTQPARKEKRKDRKKEEKEEEEIGD